MAAVRAVDPAVVPLLLPGRYAGEDLHAVRQETIALLMNEEDDKKIHSQMQCE